MAVSYVHHEVNTWDFSVAVPASFRLHLEYVSVLQNET
jgi:hypothetical protein